MSTKSSIQVCIKVRPCERGLASLWQVKDGRSIQVVDSQAEPYMFDYVFDQDSNNQAVFDRMAKPIVHACVQGFNGTIFAYGQTSSGKTYTMMGDEHNPGVMVLAAMEIFKQIKEIVDREFLLRVGYIEIYNEKIYDLLNKKNQDLKIHEASTGIVSVNCQECIITSEEGLLDNLCKGNKERTVGETNMNERSSRSHAIFRIIIESRRADRTGDDAVIQSVLNLVDLAGSERANATGARGTRLKEGGHINKSLLFLSNVIKNLSENIDNLDNKYISYRDSKLTRILQASLGGNALTSIICTIKPSIMDESQSTLNFAMSAKRIRNKPQVNEVVSDSTMMKRLEREVKELKDKLAQEERNKESQLKVKQLEQRIKSYMLNIISSTSLINSRQQKRRRTWCPATSMLTVDEAAATVGNLNIEGMAARSQLPKPNMFPMSAFVRGRTEAPKTVNIFKSLNIGLADADEEFIPGELHNFGATAADFETPKSQRQHALSLTPRVDDGQRLEMVEKDLLELQTYTNLEKQIDVKFDQYEAIMEKLAMVTSRRDELEAERLEYLQLKNDLYLSQSTQADAKTRCDALQTEISALSASNQTANAKIEEYEKELKELNQTIGKLQLENREAVSLEFEYQNHKAKAKQRETELLSAISEKDSEIKDLHQTIDELTKEGLRNTKEELMLEQSCEKICNKCVDLKDLLEEHNKVKADFEKLTQEYEKLQSNFQQISLESSAAQMKLIELTELKSAEAAECEQLRLEIVSIRTKLENVQDAYRQMSNDMAEKSEVCDRLSRDVSTAHQDFGLLQQKYDKLELSWQGQQQGIADIQADYDTIHKKYQSLQQEYEILKRSSDSTEDQCRRLQQENTNLLSEISELKERVEEAQRKLMEAPDESKAPADKTELNELNKLNVQLKETLAQVQSRFDELQREYDDLSNQLMESVQEGDALREQCEKLKEDLKKLPNVEPWRQSGDADSMKSSGVSSQCSYSDLDNDLQQQFIKYSECLHEIELSQLMGKSRVFKATEIHDQTAPGLRLCLTSAEEIIAHHFEDGHGESEEKVCLKGLLKQHRFQIVELAQNAEEEQEKPHLAYIAKLENEIAEKNLLIDATERTINEMREQMTSLECAILEKSVIVNKVEDYQRQIVSLEKQNAEISMVYEELRKESTMSESLFASSADETLGLKQSEFEQLKAVQSELEAKITELQNKIENQLQQLRVKDENIEKLQTDIQELNEKCISTELKGAELESKSNQQQQSLERQAEKLAADAKLIDQLQESNAQLSERSSKSEISVADLEQRLADLQAKLDAKLLEHSKQQEIKQGELSKESLEKDIRLNELQTALEVAKEELAAMEKQHTEEFNRLKLEYLEKLELSETRFRENFRKYNSECEEGKESYEIKLSQLNEKLAMAEEQCARLDADSKKKLQDVQNTHDMAMQKMFQENQELESLYEKKLADAEEQYDAENKKELQDIQITHDMAMQQMFKEKQELEALYEEKMAKAEEQCDADSKKELQDLQHTHDIAMQQMFKEKQELESLYDNSKKIVEQLQDQLNSQQLDSQNDLVSSANQKLQELRDKCEQQMREYEQLKSEYNNSLEKLKLEKAALQVKIEDEQLEIEKLRTALYQQSTENKMQEESLRAVKELNEELDAALKKMTAEKMMLEQLEIEKLKTALNQLRTENQKQLEDLDAALKKMSAEKMTADEKVETLNFKLSDLSEQLQQAQLRAENFEKHLLEHEEIKRLLSQSMEEKTHLAEMVKELEQRLLQAQQDGETQNVETEKLRSELESALHTKAAACKDQSNLTVKLQQLEAEMAEQARQLQHKIEELHSSMAESQLKLESLQQQKADLQKSNQELAVKLKNAVNSQSLLEEEQKTGKALRENNVQLNFQLQVAIAKNVECDALRSALKTKENRFKEDQEKLNGTISCLMADKLNLEEKLCTLEDIVKRLEIELSHKSSSTNASFDSNASNASPKARKSLERDGIVPRKSLSLESETRRSIRRICTHDERRRQSFWNDTRDVGSLTDPVDNKCNCAELNRKLQDCERNLFIKESQVTALNIELKNHPLKEENVQLKRRLQDEQEKARAELKRFKLKNQELMSKVNALTASAAISAANSQSASPAQAAVATAETQTDSDLETAYKQLSAKYDDAINVCRHRFNTIKQLEDQLKQNENCDTSNITSITAGQISALKAQCESQKKELATINEKYAMAKKALKIRRIEVDELRERVSSNNDPSPSTRP